MVGKGVANEYCHKFAGVDPAVKIEKKSLVKMTQAVMDEINKAARYNLGSAYRMNEYVYLVTGDGKDASFKGFGYDINQGVEAPYIVCTTHTQKSWEAYQATIPSEPVVPEVPDNGSQKPSEPNEAP